MLPAVGLVILCDLDILILPSQFAPISLIFEEGATPGPGAALGRGRVRKVAKIWQRKGSSGTVLQTVQSGPGLVIASIWVLCLVLGCVREILARVGYGSEYEVRLFLLRLV